MAILAHAAPANFGIGSIVVCAVIIAVVAAAFIASVAHAAR